jgi:hypothetical protein
MEPPAPPPARSGELCAWFGYWAQFVVLGLLVVLGAIVAGRGDGPGDYTTGMVLSLAAIALAFMRLKHGFDGGSSRWRDYLLVDTMGNLLFAVVAFVILALIGLFVAAGAEYGSLHDAGVALFVAAGLMIFLSLKRVFDNLDAHR